MDRIICNPLNLSYRYQHVKGGGKVVVYREGADPTLVLFKGKYYLFVSMSAGFWYSDDLVDWFFHENKNLPIYDYAPDSRQIGEYLYYSASRMKNSPIFRTLDPLSDQFELVSNTMQFWDPNIFCDDDGKVFLYWGCSPNKPIFGVEIDPNTMTPLSDKVPLVKANAKEHGFERPGENCNPKSTKGPVARLLSRFPFTEGSYLNKHNGKYYLQYATPGTEYNTYADGVYMADAPLGPFTFANHNPFSSKPGGFITSAGHGSTIQDKHGNWWHAASMRISVNKNFERRVGLFPAGFDEDGLLFCNQNFADYPLAIPDGKFDPWSIEPKWMLLSYKKSASASSSKIGHGPEQAFDEDIRTWWSAANREAGEFIEVDLGDEFAVYAIQVNLADGNIQAPKNDPQEFGGQAFMKRYIEIRKLFTRYKVEGSLDGKVWFILEDKRNTTSDLPHDLFVYQEGRKLRYVKVTAYELPYGQSFKVSGLRVFGKGDGERPAQTTATADQTGELNALVQWEAVEGAQGYNVRYGIHPNKLYLSWLLYDQTDLDLCTLNKGIPYYVCVDSFNENGVTCGKTVPITSWFPSRKS